MANDKSSSKVNMSIKAAKTAGFFQLITLKLVTKQCNSELSLCVYLPKGKKCTCQR